LTAPRPAVEGEGSDHADRMKGRAVRTRLDGTVDKAAAVGLANWRTEPTHAGFGTVRGSFTTLAGLTTGTDHECRAVALPLHLGDTSQTAQHFLLHGTDNVTRRDVSLPVKGLG